MTIQVNELSKKFFIRQDGPPQYETFKTVLSNAISSLFRFGRKKNSLRSNTILKPFWALQDVSFRVDQGDRLAIIGQNGSGKSTLLKILSRVTPPTSGKVVIKGNIASLLEVGTGFHPELTGKENIYLNGALLGMSKNQIRNKFEEIVEFADIGPFLETPVKRYSSGMYVRLAFGVAAHLETDILLVDEVLAVGDMRFQKKCIGKMEDASKQGRTIIFITHHMGSLGFCNKGILLDKGKIIPTNTLEECIQQYSQTFFHALQPVWNGDVGDDEVRLRSLEITPLDGGLYFKRNEKAKLTTVIEVLRPVEDFVLGYLFSNKHGMNLLHHKIQYQGQILMSLKPGVYHIETLADLSQFGSGSFKVQLEMGIHQKKRIPHTDVSIQFELINPAKKEAEPENIIFPEWPTVITGNNEPLA